MTNGLELKSQEVSDSSQSTFAVATSASMVEVAKSFSVFGIGVFPTSPTDAVIVGVRASRMTVAHGAFITPRRRSRSNVVPKSELPLFP